MPTVAISPSIRSHSWSSVNFSIGLHRSISVAFVAVRHERQITDSQRNALAAHLAENPLTGRCKIPVDAAHRDRRLHSRPKAAGCDGADRACGNLVGVEFCAGAHGHAILDLQSDTAAWGALRYLPQNDLGAWESARARSADAADSRNRPFERGHHWCRCRIEIRPIETQPGFQPQTVARAKSDRHHRLFFALRTRQCLS